MTRLTPQDLTMACTTIYPQTVCILLPERKCASLSDQAFYLCYDWWALAGV